MNGEVLVLQHEPAEGLGRIAPALAAHALRPRIIRRDLGEPLPDRSEMPGFAALIVLGGSLGVADIPSHPGLAAELDLVRGALAGDLPVLGVCLGSQLMAHALGSSHWSGHWELGWGEVTGTATGDGSDLPDTFPALHWHRDRYNLPPGCQLLARTDSTPCQAFRTGRHLGLLFHLEAGPAQVSAMADHLAADLVAAGRSRSELDLATAGHAAAAADLADRVFGNWAAMFSSSAARG